MPKINGIAVIKILLILLGFVYILGAVSRSFDFDFGWHLRFGQDFWVTKTFQYTDTYTYAFFGEKWTNHEWGGDLLLYPIYRHFGYFAWVLFIALAAWAGFIIALKIFQTKITITGAAVLLFSAMSIQHIFSPRLSMLSLPLFAVLWYFLEKLPRQKNYWLWPILFWLWAALHGSWILGFIVIGIYIAGASANLLCQKYWPRLYTAGGWGWREIKIALLFFILSAAAVCLNPYGINIWREVLEYFTASFGKSKILEWMPSYAYPVYWQALALGAAGGTFAVIAFFKRRLSWPQIILALAFFCAAWLYKRQAMWTALAFVPLFTAIIAEALSGLKTIGMGRYLFASSTKMWTGFFTTTIAVLMLVYQITNIHFTRDVWSDKYLLGRAQMPMDAVNFLRQKIGDGTADIFNEFAWGGYMNWALPNARVFFDGRGALTWETRDGANALAEYLNIGNESGGLAKISSSSARYVLIGKTANIPRPDPVNLLLFGEEKLNKLFSPQPLRLEDDLRASESWKVVYEDRLATIWERR